MAMIAAYGGRTSQGILNPVAPQGVVVSNAIVQPNLVETRQREPSPRYPVHNSPSDLAVKRGEWAFMLAGRAARHVTPFRPNMDDLAIFSAAGGLPAEVDGPGDVAFAGHVDAPGTVDGMAGDGTVQPELGCVVRRAGTCSGINHGSGYIHAGSRVYWDWPEIRPGSEAHPMPRLGLRTDRTKFHFSTKVMQPNSPFNYLMAIWRALVTAYRTQSDLFTKPLSEVLRILHEKHAPLSGIGVRHDIVLRLARGLEKEFPGFSLETIAATVVAADNNEADDDGEAVARAAQAGGGLFNAAVAFVAWLNADAVNATKFRSLLSTVVRHEEMESALENLVPGAHAKLAGALEDLSTADKLLDTLILSLCFIPHALQDMQNVIDSRYMGLALSDAPFGGQLDLLLG